MQLKQTSIIKVSGIPCNLNSINMVFAKRHMACKNVTNVVFVNARKVAMNWSLEATFANYIRMYLVAKCY